MTTRREMLSLLRKGTLSSVSACLPFLVRAQMIQATTRLLVGFGAGGAIDVIARLLVDSMKDYSASFIVDNRPGAGGRLGVPGACPS